MLTPEAIKLLGSNKSQITKDESKVLAHCNIANNDYQQDSRVLHTFVPSKLFGQS